MSLSHKHTCQDTQTELTIVCVSYSVTCVCVINSCNLRSCLSGINLPVHKMQLICYQPSIQNIVHPHSIQSWHHLTRLTLARLTLAKFTLPGYLTMWVIIFHIWLSLVEHWPWSLLFRSWWLSLLSRTLSLTLIVHCITRMTLSWWTSHPWGFLSWLLYYVQVYPYTQIFTSNSKISA